MNTWIKILTGLVAIETLIIAIYCCSELEISSSSPSVLISALGVLVTFVVAWQIWQTIKAKQELAEARRDIENRCGERLKEFEKKMRRDRILNIQKKQSLDEKLDELDDKLKDTAIMKYYHNDAMGSMHYNDGRMMEGMLDVIENLYLISLPKDVDLFKEYFQDEYYDKLDVAIYFIANNLKKYKRDQIVNERDKDRFKKRLKKISDRWKKRYEQIVNHGSVPTDVLDCLKILNQIFKHLVDGVKKDGYGYNMSSEDMASLNRMTGN